MAPNTMAWIFLIGSIATEVLGMISLKYSNGFSKLMPTSLAVFCIMISLWLISLSFKQLEMGVSYAIWASASTALVAIVGIAFYAETITSFKVTGITLIVIGVVMLNLSAK
jgi:small multidrug resistance pump